ncbi:hypothetical protein [Streptomyces sp. NPDC027717]|uniref:hypothetical protein n=1 Tax=Streptomyces sp. NPDC027717 TaxID=3155765 RepID=UPI0033C0255C
MATEREARDLAVLLTPDGNLAPAWLKGKSVTPLHVGERLDATQAARLTAGARAIGATHLLYASLGEEDPAVTTRETPADAATLPHTFIWTPDRQGAVLFPAPGYALLAGTEPFMATAVPEGTDEARARFTRYARKRAAIRPELLAVAAKYSPAHTAWSHPADVAPNTAAGHQLQLLRDFTNGTVPATDFAHIWWQARRASRSNGERLRGPLAELFDRVFMLLEDYEVDPQLAEPTDLSATELHAAVTEAYRKIVPTARTI